MRLECEGESVSLALHFLVVHQVGDLRCRGLGRIAACGILEDDFHVHGLVEEGLDDESVIVVDEKADLGRAFETHLKVA